MALLTTNLLSWSQLLKPVVGLFIESHLQEWFPSWIQPDRCDLLYFLFGIVFLLIVSIWHRREANIRQFDIIWRCIRFDNKWSTGRNVLIKSISVSFLKDVSCPSISSAGKKSSNIFSRPNSYRNFVSRQKCIFRLLDNTISHGKIQCMKTRKNIYMSIAYTNCYFLCARRLLLHRQILIFYFPTMCFITLVVYNTIYLNITWSNSSKVYYGINLNNMYNPI